jgi:ligand-binding sensor domain-containing protein
MTSRTLIIISLIFLFACAEEGEVSKSSRDKWTYYDQGDGLASNIVLALFEDNKEQIWIGTDKGLNVFTGSSFVHYDTNDGLVSNIVYSIVSDDQGNFWVGTENGINILIDGDWFYASFFDGVVITSLLKLTNGDVVLGTEGYGAYVYQYAQQGFYEYYVSSTCADCNYINTLFENKPNEVWIGTEGGLQKKTGSSVTSYTTSQGLPDNDVRSITKDTWGNIWIGTYDGSQVSRFTNGKWENIDLANFYLQSWVWDLEVDDDGILWVSTFVGGLHRYDGTVMRKEFEVYPDESVSALLKDAKGNIWVGTLSSGMAKYTP